MTGPRGTYKKDLIRDSDEIVALNGDLWVALQRWHVTRPAAYRAYHRADRPDLYDRLMVSDPSSAPARKPARPRKVACLVPIPDEVVFGDECARPGCDDGTDVCALHRDDSDTDTCDGLSLDAAVDRSRGI